MRCSSAMPSRHAGLPKVTQNAQTIELTAPPGQFRRSGMINALASVGGIHAGGTTSRRGAVGLRTFSGKAVASFDAPCEQAANVGSGPSRGFTVRQRRISNPPQVTNLPHMRFTNLPASHIRHELIAYPRLRQNIPGLAGIGLDLFPHLIDEDAQVLGLVAVVGAPHGLQ